MKNTIAFAGKENDGIRIPLITFILHLRKKIKILHSHLEFLQSL